MFLSHSNPKQQVLLACLKVELNLVFRASLLMLEEAERGEWRQILSLIAGAGLDTLKIFPPSFRFPPEQGRKVQGEASHHPELFLRTRHYFSEAP